MQNVRSISDKDVTYIITSENVSTVHTDLSNLARKFKVLAAASMKFRLVSWDVLPCKIIVDRRFRRTCCLSHQG
jgi:hypothetical protein